MPTSYYLSFTYSFIVYHLKYLMQYYQPSLFAILCGLVLLFSCNKKIAIEESPRLPLEYSAAPFEITTPHKFAQNIAYSDHQHTTFDILLPASNEPTALVIFIHGGGFANGDKTKAYERYKSQIREFLSRNIAFATINYRFLSDTDKGVIASLRDSKRCLQFLKYYAASFNIDKNRIACFGSSAGAGTSLWMGLSDDMAEPNSPDPILRESTRTPAIGAIATQATYDILRYEEVFKDYNISIERIPAQFLQRLNPFYGLSDFSEVHNPEIVKYRAQVDMLKLMDKNDPPIWVKNEQKDVSPMLDLQHHPAHARLLKTYADSIGLESRFYIPGYKIEDPSGEGLIDFFDRILNGEDHN